MAKHYTHKFVDSILGDPLVSIFYYDFGDVAFAVIHTTLEDVFFGELWGDRHLVAEDSVPVTGRLGCLSSDFVMTTYIFEG